MESHSTDSKVSGVPLKNQCFWLTTHYRFACPLNAHFVSWEQSKFSINSFLLKWRLLSGIHQNFIELFIARSCIDHIEDAIKSIPIFALTTALSNRQMPYQRWSNLRDGLLITLISRTTFAVEQMFSLIKTKQCIQTCQASVRKPSMKLQVL